MAGAVIRFFTPAQSTVSREARAARDAARGYRDEAETIGGTAGAAAGEAAGAAAAAPYAAAAGQAKSDAETARDGAENAATSASADAALATGARASAADAALSAGLSAAQALTASPIYPDIATGRAAVADGDTFSVAGADDSFAILYRRDSSSTQTELGRFPSLAAVQKGTLSSGELIARRHVPDVTLQNGAANILDAGGNEAGISVPSGQTGTNSFVTSWIPFLPREIARLAGKSILLRVVYTATAGFLTDKPISAAVPAQARRPSTAVTTGTVVSTEQVGTTITRVVRVTVDPTDTAIGVTAQLTSASTASTHTLLPISVSYQPEYNDDAQVGRVEAQRPVGIGSIFDQLGFAATANNGASILVNAGRKIGWTTPIGSTGDGSFARPRYPIRPELRALLTGCTLIVRATMAVTNNAKIINASANMQLAASLANRTGTILLRYATATTRVIEFTVTMQGDELEFLPLLQQATTATNAVATETAQVTDISIVDIIAPSGATLDVNEIGLLARRHAAPPAVALARVENDVLVYSTPGTSAQATASATGRGLVFPAVVSDGWKALQLAFYARDYDITALTGRIVRWMWTLDCSAGFTRVPTLTTNINNGVSTVTRTVYELRIQRISSTRFQVIWNQAITGDEKVFFPFLRFDTATSAGVETIEHASLDWQIVGGTGDVGDAAAENQRAFGDRTKIAAANLALSRLWGSYKQTVGVRAGGGSDFTTISAALASMEVYPTISKATAAERVAVIVQPGEIADGDIQSRDFVDVIGEDQRRCLVLYRNPDNVAVATTRDNSVFDHTRSSLIRGLTMICRNARYTVHIDDVTGGKFTRSEIEDCTLVHEGNDGAVAYQTSLGGGGDPGNVWGTTRPLGLGSADGQYMRFSRLMLRSWKVPVVGWHSNGDFSRRAMMLLEDSHLVSDGPLGVGSGEAVVITCNDARELNDVVLRNLNHVGRIRVETPASLAGAKTISPIRDTDLTATGIEGAVYYSTSNLDRVLRIVTADTTSAGSVALSGTAVAYLLGTVVQTRPGGGGLAADAYGDLECGIVSLEARLGAHGGSPVTLSVALDGGAPIVVVFTGDYSASPAVTVLGLINAALGAAGTASLFNAFALYRANVPDQQEMVCNVDTVGVDIGTAMAWSGQRGNVRVMTNADPASAFAGLVLERMPPNAWGRVQSGGYVTIAQDVIRSDGVAFAMGDTFEVGSTAGRVQIGATRPILVATNSTEARIIETGRLFA